MCNHTSLEPILEFLRQTAKMKGLLHSWEGVPQLFRMADFWYFFGHLSYFKDIPKLFLDPKKISGDPKNEGGENLTS